MEESTPWGFAIASGTTNTVAESFSFTDTFANFTAIEPGYLLKIPGILVGGQPLVIPITAVPSTTSLTLSGRIPTTLASTGYTIYNPKEGAINLHISTTAKDTSSNRLYLGEINWTGSAVSVVNYRYLNKYTSPVVRVSALTGSYGDVVFTHNLGFIPAAFTLYFKEEVGGVASGDPKVLHIGDEAIVKTINYIMTVRNRYANLVARTYDGTAKDVGYLQLVI
jgi:hypothetical protein